MKENEHLTLEGIKKIISIRASMNKGLSHNLKRAIPNIVPITRPTVSLDGVKDPFVINRFRWWWGKLKEKIII